MLWVTLLYIVPPVTLLYMHLNIDTQFVQIFEDSNVVMLKVVFSDMIVMNNFNISVLLKSSFLWICDPHFWSASQLLCHIIYPTNTKQPRFLETLKWFSKLYNFASFKLPIGPKPNDATGPFAYNKYNNLMKTN